MDGKTEVPPGDKAEKAVTPSAIPPVVESAVRSKFTKSAAQKRLRQFLGPFARVKGGPGAYVVGLDEHGRWSVLAEGSDLFDVCSRAIDIVGKVMARPTAQ